ncbi:flavodoxin family protein [Candidatus Bipolaricaulota bacterium]|nr:flavodoxin family protein [Candidatus Bipolaricaulota bacterium]
MDIGIVVHSQTGHTHSVAEKLREKLATAGHTVTLERLEAEGEVRPGVKDVRLKSVPNVEAYDAIVFGSPVHGFALALAMQAYLRQVPSLAGKRAACFVTQSFPFAWMGGDRALRQMTRACQAKGATICGVGVVNWSRRSREQQIAAMVDRLSRHLPS